MTQKFNIPYLFSAASRRAVAIAALAACLPAGSAVAAPSYYNMPNGGSASYNYWDESYNGSGCVTCNYVPLSGGRGDLTDGFIATSNWNVTEAPPGNGPYVGWLIDPTITFHWNSSISIGSVTFYFDDSGFGGVRPPASVIVNGTTYAVTDPDPASRAPFAFTAGGVSFTGNDLVVTINRDRGGWVFLSEVEFNGVSNAPEPGTLALLGLGLAGLAASRRRRQ
jgi:hypothetical protein